MPKFYIETGKHKQIVCEDDVIMAVELFIASISDENGRPEGMGKALYIDERGFIPSGKKEQENRIKNSIIIKNQDQDIAFDYIEGRTMFISYDVLFGTRE